MLIMVLRDMHVAIQDFVLVAVKQLQILELLCLPAQRYVF